MQPNSQNSLGDPSLRSHRSQYTEHHPTEPAANSDNTYREVECNEPEDVSDTRGVRTSRQYIESSDEREVEEDEDLEEGDDAQNEQEEDDDVNSDIEDEHLEEEHHNKTSLPDVEEEEEEDAEDAEDAENDEESDHKEEVQKPIEQEYQSFGNPENSNKPTQPPVTPEEKIDETKDKSRYARPSHSGSPNRSRVHNYSSINASQMNHTGVPNYLRDFSPSKVTVEEFEEYYEIFCINFLKRREEELEKKRRAQAELELAELQDRPHINANPNKHHIPLLQRTPLLNARREKEIEKMRKEKEAKLAKELEELTFKPNINERSRGLASSSPTKSYYNSSSTNQGSSKKKSPKKARKVGTFKPKINENSRAMAKGVKERTADDVVDRLYYQSNLSQSKKEELTKQLTPRFTPFLNRNTEKIHRKKHKDDASSFQGQKYENSDHAQEYSDNEEQHHGGKSARSGRSTRRFDTEPAYQTPRKTQQYGVEEASNEELLAILKQFNNMLKKKNENPINLQQLGSLMAGYADKRRSQREQASAQRDQEISSTMEKNLKQVHGSLKNLRDQSSENPSKVRFDDDEEEEEEGKSYSTTGKMIKATYKTIEPTKKSPKKQKKFQTEKTETHETTSEAPLNISSYSSQAVANHSSLSKSGALPKDNRSSASNLRSNSNLDNTTEKSMSKKKKKGDNESPKKKKKKDSSVSKTEEIENSQNQEEKKKKKKARSKDRGMNTDEIVVLEKGTQTSKKSKKNGQSNSDFSSQVVGSKNAIEGWYQSNQDGKDDDIIFVSNEGHQTDEERGLMQTNQPQETSFGSQSGGCQDVNVNNFRSNHSQRVKYYDSEKSKGSSSNNVGKSQQGENYYSSKGRSQNPEASSKQGGLSEKSDQSENNRSKSQKSRQNLEEKNRSQNHFTASEDEVAGEEYEEFEQEEEEEEKPKSCNNNKKRSKTGSEAGSKGSSQKERSKGSSQKERSKGPSSSSTRKEKSRESREYAEDRSLQQEQEHEQPKSQLQSQQQLGRNRAQTNEVKPQTQPSAQELSRRRGYSDPKAEKSPLNRTPSKNHQSKKPSGFRESSLDRNQKNSHTHNSHHTADKFRSISSISGDVQSDDDPEKILSFNDEKGFTKSIDSSSNSHDDSETDKEDKEEASGGQIRNRVESISFSANNKAFNYRSNQSDQQQVPQSAQSKHENDSVKSKNSHSTQERLKPEERRQGRNHHKPVQYEVMSTETIQIQPSTKRSSYGYAMDRNDRTLNSASSRGLKAIAQHIVKKFKAYDEQIKKSAKEYTISVSPPRSGSRSQSHSYSPEASRNQTPEMKIQEPQVAEKKYFKTAHKAQLDSVEKSSKKHRMSLQGDSGSRKKVEGVKRYTVGSR